MASNWKFFSSAEAPVNETTKNLRTKISYLSTPAETFYTYVYASMISGNTFEENMAGQSGTALYIRQMSYITVVGNTFLKNQPVYSFVPAASLSPFYVYLTGKKRHSMFHSSSADIKKLEFFEKSSEPAQAAKRLFLPQVQGAIFY